MSHKPEETTQRLTELSYSTRQNETTTRFAGTRDSMNIIKKGFLPELQDTERNQGSIDQQPTSERLERQQDPAKFDTPKAGNFQNKVQPTQDVSTNEQPKVASA